MPMKDFKEIAKQMNGTMSRLDALLRQHGFFKSEDLAGPRASEIWLRPAGNEFFAVRIDWMGHSSHASFAHCHFEAFPADRRFDYEHVTNEKPEKGRVPVTKFDTKTGLATKNAQHVELIRDDS